MQEITPEHYRCGFTAECPAAFRLQDGRIVLIVKKAGADILEKLAGRIGADEHVVVVDPELLENVFER